MVMPKEAKPHYITPSLESITVKGKYEIPEIDFNIVYDKVLKELQPKCWHTLLRVGDSIQLLRMSSVVLTKCEIEKKWVSYLEGVRAGTPVFFQIVTVEYHQQNILVEVECHPAMWHIIGYSPYQKARFTENQVQEALLECKTFVKQVMSIFRGKEIEPVSVYPIIQRTEIKDRLVNLGLKEIAEALGKAEEHIVQNDFSESLKSSRTAFEKMIDWQMNKRGLSQTNSYHNNLERIKSKGYLDPETTKLLQTYYECLSIIVHEKGVKPGIFEAQMGYGMTLIMLDYFANKLP